MKALLVIDIQNDFLPGGSLAVPEGDQVIPVVNELMPHYDLVVATQDFHPADHSSFASNHSDRKAGEIIDLNGQEQVLWPDHCVEGTGGAALAGALNTVGIDRIFQKGRDPQIDSYSGFFDNGHLQSTGLGDFLRSERVKEVHLVGVATDYCVKFTALDAIAEGFETWLIIDACRGVNLQPGDVDRAVEEMKNVGVQVWESDQVLKRNIIGKIEVIKRFEPIPMKT